MVRLSTSACVDKLANRRIATFCMLLSSALPLFLSAPQAHADPLTPMQRCQSNLPPTISWPFIQQGNTIGVNFPVGSNPPNGIFPGNVMRVLIDEGSMVDISYWGEWYGVDGKSEAATSGYPFPGWPKYGDYYRLNNNPGGWVASGSDSNPWDPHPLRELSVCTSAPNIPVRLITQINDDNIGDNQGSWHFTLQIWQ